MPTERGFAASFLEETVQVVRALGPDAIDDVAHGLAGVRERGGRLFVLGIGGSAGHAGHLVNDVRKLCGIEAYAPTDNVSELTARANDDGWASVFRGWLEVSRLRADDAVLVLSVGGGDLERNVSAPIVEALELAVSVGASIYGIVGRDGGHTATVATACVVIPPVFGGRITPHTEGICAVVWHLLVSHPALQQRATAWESLAATEQAA